MANFKNPLDASKDAAKKNKVPFDFKADFASRVARNPDYKKIADALSGDDEDLNDAYFYALKDAHEKSKNFNPTADDIRREAQERYYALADSYGDRWGFYGRDWDYYGQPRFEEKYGTEDAFIRKLLNAWFDSEDY